MPTRKEIPTSVGLVVVSQAGPSDAPGLRNIRIEALEQHPQSFAADLDAARAETPQDWVERLVGEGGHPRMAIFKAESEGTVVGMAGIIPGHWPKIAHSAGIWGVYVRKGYRGQGIGRALLEACFGWAQTEGVLIVRLSVITTNLPAIRCYTAAGFTPDGVKPKAIRWQGQYLDELMLSRPVEPGNQE